MRSEPVGSTRALSRLAQNVRLALYRQIECRLLAVGERNGAGRGRAISRNPARHQPGWCIEDGGVERGKLLAAFADQAPQHRIDEPGIVQRPAVGACELHGKIDGSVIGHIEPKDLRCPEQECGLDARRVGRQAAVEINPQQVAQRAEPAQNGGHEPADQRAVTFVDGCQELVAKLLIERPPSSQHAVEHVGGNAASSEARCVLARNRAGSHARRR